MDPDATYQTLREQAEAFHARPGAAQFDATEFVDAFAALDEWLRGGGFLPGAWAKNR